MLIAYTAAANTPDAPGGQPWWVTATLTAMGLIAGVITTVWARRGNGQDSTPPPPAPPKPLEQAPSATTTIRLEPSPTTADGKLELAEKYVQMLERSEVELTGRVTALSADLERLRLDLAAVHLRAEWAEGQARERAETIAYLRALLDRAQVGPRPPLPPGSVRWEPPTDPTSR